MNPRVFLPSVFTALWLCCGPVGCRGINSSTVVATALVKGQDPHAVPTEVPPSWDDQSRVDRPTDFEDSRPDPSLADLLQQPQGLPARIPERLVSGLAAEQDATGITLDGLETTAATAHPALARAASQLEAARGQFDQAGLPFNPVMQYQSDEIGNEDSSGLHSVSITQQFVTANKLAMAQQVQAQTVAKRRARWQRARLQVLTRVRTAFAHALVAQRRVELTEELTRLAETSVVAVEALFDAEEVSKITLLQARLESEQASIRANNARLQSNAARAALAAAVGIDSLPPEPLLGDVNENLPEAPWDERLAKITATSPEIASAGSELERARWALQLACAQVIPNVTGQVGVGVDTATDDTFAVVGVSVPLPIRNRNQGHIRAARAGVAAAAADIEVTRLDLAGRLADAIGRYQAARQQLEQLRAVVVPHAEETYELSRQAFEGGEVDFLQLLTAQRTLFNTQLDVLEAAATAQTANAELEGLLVQSD